MSQIQLKTLNGENIPLKNSAMNIDVCDHIAQFTIVQSYQNIVSYDQLAQFYKTNDTHPILLINFAELPNHIISNNVLIAKTVGPLPFSYKLKINDYIVIVGTQNNNIYDGTYRVQNIGTHSKKWVLVKENV